MLKKLWPWLEPVYPANTEYNKPKKFIDELSGSGILIASGLAYGIDVSA